MKLAKRSDIELSDYFYFMIYKQSVLIQKVKCAGQWESNRSVKVVSCVVLIVHMPNNP